MPTILTINREDMLELTRRMNPARTSMTRIAGCYLDKDNFIDGTFNTNFLKLSHSQKTSNLNIAKTIPFSPTNQNLKRYKFSTETLKNVGIRQLLLGIKTCGLKNDALLDTFYDYIAEHYHSTHDYAIYLYHNIYDIPLKASDHESLWESEEIYEYIICAFCPVTGDYEPDKPECGFIFPAFCDRSEDPSYIDVYQKNPDHPHTDLLQILELL